MKRKREHWHQPVVKTLRVLKETRPAVTNEVVSYNYVKEELLQYGTTFIWLWLWHGPQQFMGLKPKFCPLWYPISNVLVVQWPFFLKTKYKNVVMISSNTMPIEYKSLGGQTHARVHVHTHAVTESLTSLLSEVFGCSYFYFTF